MNPQPAPPTAWGPEPCLSPHVCAGDTDSGCPQRRWPERLATVVPLHLLPAHLLGFTASWGPGIAIGAASGPQLPLGVSGREAQDVARQPSSGALQPPGAPQVGQLYFRAWDSRAERQRWRPTGAVIQAARPAGELGVCSTAGLCLSLHGPRSSLPHSCPWVHFRAREGREAALTPDFTAAATASWPVTAGGR